jgi:hypothetical protein
VLDLPAVRTFRLSRNGVECDEQGLRVGGLPLLAREGRGAWKARDERDLGYDLSRVYGFRVDARAKMAGFGVVAKSLQDGNLAKAQVAALLLRLPDPLSRAGGALGKSAEWRLYYDLVACGLLKADADWDEKHPRTGSPPNRGWFAPKPKDARADEPPKADAKPIEGSSLHGSERAFLPSAPLVAPPLLTGPGSWLTGDLPATVLDGLVRLAARFSAPAILFGAIFIPSANGLVDEGPVPGRPNMTYRWAHDEVQLTFKALIDGQWRELTTGFFIARDGAYYDKDGQIVARVVQGARRPTLVTNTDVLDNALARLSPGDREPDASAAPKDREPKLCPDPTPEPKTAGDKINSIKYQEYVSGIPYGWAINVGGVNFDGCDPKTGILLEAKADINHLFDEKDTIFHWAIKKKNKLGNQMIRQADAAEAAGRIAVWHAQSAKGYRGLVTMAGTLGKQHESVLKLRFVHDPN